MSLSEFTFILAMLLLCVACVTYVIKQIIICAIKIAEIRKELTCMDMSDDDKNGTHTL